MQMITISYSGVKHPDREHEQKIISAMESIGFEFDGSDMSFDEDMTRGLFFFAPEGTTVEVTELDE